MKGETDEAKEYLIDISHTFGNMSIEYLTEKDGEKMREAIKALNQEPCDDAISRKAVIDLIADYDLSMGQVVKGIHALPPVTPRPKIGHWIDTDDYYQRWKCSECGCHTRDVEPPFCPNCGVKMKSEG